MTTLISPDLLHADAVVPQCLDNQFVSDVVFTKMLKEGRDFRDTTISSLRQADFKTEFIRSLVYSSQVVIQRAYFKNSDFLYQQYDPSNSLNLNAFAHLVETNAIVPYLWRESSLLDGLNFDQSIAGDRATEALMDRLGGAATCVRLDLPSKLIAIFFSPRIRVIYD